MTHTTLKFTQILQVYDVFSSTPRNECFFLKNGLIRALINCVTFSEHKSALQYPGNLRNLSPRGKTHAECSQLYFIPKVDTKIQRLRCNFNYCEFLFN